ncbi:peroxiredoxin family protein [Saccharicrinis sp. FJH62]|uniref:peroxiredoxin family protein n=1 Tax=Saccharicrinis sp. FJH62 TaxID=3344657 RepID=UPI0035D46C66
MKITYFIFFITITAGIISCSSRKENMNSFSSTDDTLIISSVKHQGINIFSIGASKLPFRDSSEWKSLDWFKSYPDYKISYPDNIQDLKLSFRNVFFIPFRYYDKSSNKVIMQKNRTLADQQIIIITGKLEGREVLIIDSNNNKDLRDDPIRTIHEFDWRHKKNLIDCTFSVDYGDKVVEDTGWFQIGLYKQNLYEATAQHLLADIYIDAEKYQIGVIDDNTTSFCFFSPMLGVLESNGIKKDTLAKDERIELGEYLSLGGQFYKFHKLYSGSGTIVLTKNSRPDTLTGTQKGMLAADFKVNTMEGELVSSENFKGRYLLLINVSACWSQVSSYQCYKDLTETYKDKFDYLGIDYSPVTLRQNIKDLKLSGQFIIAENNSMIQKTYRPEYCSRTCFLINPEGRIADRFEIFDWKSHLANFFEN